MKRLFVLLMAGLMGTVLFSAKSAHAGDEGLKVGVLVCTAIPDSGYNLIITSSVKVNCKFTDVHGDKEFYVGETGIGLGVNLNFKSKEELAWTVMGATSDYKAGSHALAGKYAGAKASASLGVGTGAAVLVGGGEKNFSLQPVALEANQGIGAAAGLGYLYLEPYKKKSEK